MSIFLRRCSSERTNLCSIKYFQLKIHILLVEIFVYEWYQTQSSIYSLAVEKYPKESPFVVITLKIPEADHQLNFRAPYDPKSATDSLTPSSSHKSKQHTLQPPNPNSPTINTWYLTTRLRNIGDTLIAIIHCGFAHTNKLRGFSNNCRHCKLPAMSGMGCL